MLAANLLYVSLRHFTTAEVLAFSAGGNPFYRLSITSHGNDAEEIAR